MTSKSLGQPFSEEGFELLMESEGLPNFEELERIELNTSFRNSTVGRTPDRPDKVLNCATMLTAKKAGLSVPIVSDSNLEP